MKKFFVLITLIMSAEMAISQKVISTQSTDGLIVRIAEIEVYPEYLSEYLAYATEVDRLSVEREPGVICLFPMQDPADSCQIRILEIYANDDVYQAHLKTDHFQKYKQGTLKMVKSLKLNTMQPMDKEMMKAMFGRCGENHTTKNLLENQYYNKLIYLSN